MDNIISMLKNFTLESLPDYAFSPEDRQFLQETAEQLNSELTLKEAGSWESATRFILTD